MCGPLAELTERQCSAHLTGGCSRLSPARPPPPPPLRPPHPPNPGRKPPAAVWPRRVPTGLAGRGAPRHTVGVEGFLGKGFSWVGGRAGGAFHRPVHAQTRRQGRLCADQHAAVHATRASNPRPTPSKPLQNPPNPFKTLKTPSKPPLTTPPTPPKLRGRDQPVGGGHCQPAALDPQRRVEQNREGGRQRGAPVSAGGLAGLRPGLLRMERSARPAHS